MTVPGLVGAVAGEASDAASRAASHVGTGYRAISDAASAAARTRATRARNRVPLPSLNVHRGFRAYRWLLERTRPVLWLHGHTPLASVPWRSTEA